MIRIENKQDCCGCGACQQKCPKQCINMVQDKEGFLYPQIDTSTCIECGLCEKVCHERHPYEERVPIQIFAARNKDAAIRLNSSSGGIFNLIAEYVIKKGGVVFGARFDDDWQVTLDYTESIEGLEAFRGSKYVQSRTENAYRRAEKFLKDGRLVLFTGSPCQIAGIHHYLCKQYDNLITVDFVCHGVPSPKVWRKYLDEITDFNRLSINRIYFRNKDNGWKEYNFKVIFNKCDSNSNSCVMSSCHKKNPYMRAFLSDMILRPSCYECKAKQGRSMSDLTIADFWGVNKNYPEMDDDKGTSLVLVNNERGVRVFESLSIDKLNVEYKDAVLYNKGLSPIAKSHPHRKRFFDEFDDVNSVIELMNCQLRQPLMKRIRNRVKKIMKLVFHNVSQII